MRMGAAQDAKVDMSGNDKADIMAKKTNYDIWTRDDVKGCHSWARGESCRIPNKRLAKGGRLHKLINIICNNCEEVHTVLMSNKIFQNAESDPTQPSGLELRRQFVAPLAKRVSVGMMSHVLFCPGGGNITAFAIDIVVFVNPISVHLVVPWVGVLNPYGTC
ncbi:unnamed protein product [Discosporangium mesarthrocarpum]